MLHTIDSVSCLKGNYMTEMMDQSQEVAKPESKIVEGFQETRDRVLQESADVGKIYLAMRKPGITDVYQAWVKNMDVVANSYSWGKDKTALRTRLMKMTNRVVGAGVAALSVPEVVMDALTWLPRQVPVVGRLLPDHLWRRAQIRLAVSAKNEALWARGVVKVGTNVGEKVVRAVDAPVKAVSEAVQFAALHTNPQQILVEDRAAKVASKILYPRTK